jgi:hypothetical protein
MLSFSRTTVFGGESFYAQPPFRSVFFLVDTFLLLAVTGIASFILWSYWSDLTVPSVVRLLGVMLGIWFIWWKAYASHRQINTLYAFRKNAESENGTILAELVRVAATMTHNAMFLLYLLVAMLLINYDYVLSHRR